MMKIKDLLRRISSLKSDNNLAMFWHMSKYYLILNDIFYVIMIIGM